MKENVKGPEMDKSGSKVYAIRTEIKRVFFSMKKRTGSLKKFNSKDC